MQCPYSRGCSKHSDVIAGFLCVLIAVTLQIQVTILASPTYLGLRINLTDLLVPFAGAAILFSLLKHESAWPKWRMDHFYKWILTITALLALALLNTYIQYEKINSWGLVNKLFGWFVLVGIMGVGGWIAANARQLQMEKYLRVFLCIALIVLIGQIAILVARAFDELVGYLPNNTFTMIPLAGLMANRNAYALFFMAVISLATCFYFSKTPILPPVITYAFYAIFPFFVVFNGSRTASFTLLLIIGALLLTHRKQARKCIYIFLSLLFGLSVFFGIYHNRWEALNFLTPKMYDVVVQTKNTMEASQPVIPSDVAQSVSNPGDSMRLKILEGAFEMVEKNPVFGSGLGSVFFEQQEKHHRMINLIDCTPLWLLVEMGAIGLIVFTLFYFRVIKSLWTSIKTDEEFTRTLRVSLLYIIGGFSIMCLLHEIMYTRHMWFLIGVGLALPTRMRQDV